MSNALMPREKQFYFSRCLFHLWLRKLFFSILFLLFFSSFTFSYSFVIPSYIPCGHDSYFTTITQRNFCFTSHTIYLGSNETSLNCRHQKTIIYSRDGIKDKQKWDDTGFTMDMNCVICEHQNSKRWITTEMSNIRMLHYWVVNSRYDRLFLKNSLSLAHAHTFYESIDESPLILCIHWCLHSLFPEYQMRLIWFYGVRFS